jgi:hypothetical protein
MEAGQAAAAFYCGDRVMADYADLTPEQMMMLYRMGMGGSNPDVAQGGGKAGAFQTSVQNVENEYGRMANANISASGGEDLKLRAALNAAMSSTPRGSGTTISPQLAAEYGRLSAQYGQNYQDGVRQGQTIGGGVDLGPAQLQAMRNIASAGPSSTTYSVNVPTSVATIGGQMTQGAGIPTSYGARAQIPGLLGGLAEIVGEITPSTKDKAIYARYRKQF